MKVIDFEEAGNFLRMKKETDLQELRSELESVAAIQNEKISRSERECLFVRKAVSFLPENYRLTFYLKFWENNSLEEIADILCVSIGVVRTNYLVGLRFLEQELGPYLRENRFFLRSEQQRAN